MTEEIKIENNIPIGKVGEQNAFQKHRELYETFDRMEVSQSIVLDSMKKINSVRSYARKNNKTICYRKLDEQVWRIWRTK